MGAVADGILYGEVGRRARGDEQLSHKMDERGRKNVLFGVLRRRLLHCEEGMVSRLDPFDYDSPGYRILKVKDGTI